MKIDFECPDCGDWFTVNDETDKQVRCKDCGCVFGIDYDAEFSNGIWTNRTRLVKQHGPSALPVIGTLITGAMLFGLFWLLWVVL